MSYPLIIVDILNEDIMEKNCQYPLVSVFNLESFSKLFVAEIAPSWTNAIVWNNTSKWAVSTVITAFNLEGEGVRRYK